MTVGAVRSGARGRWATFPAEDQLPAAPPPVPSVGPVVFTVCLDGRELAVDLSDLPCPRLVRPLAEVLRDRAGEDGRSRSVDAYMKSELGRQATRASRT